MPYEEDKTLVDKSTNITHSVPRTHSEKLQKEFTTQQVADMSSELSKANRKLRSGVFNQSQYKEEREKIFSKYNITKDERIKFLGAKFAT